MFEPRLMTEEIGNLTLERDVVKGLKVAVANNQMRLAFEYTTVLIDDLVSYVEALETRIDTLEARVKAPARKATAKTKVTDAEQD